MQSLIVQKKTFCFLFIAFMAMFVYSFFPTLTDLWVRWNKFDESYSHGMLVLAISAYYLFMVLRELPEAQFRPAPWGVFLIFGSSVLWVLAYYASIEAIQQLLLPWIIWLFCLTTLGWKASKKLIFPIAFLYFAIPIWDVLIIPLQYITTDVNGVLLSIAGVTAHIEDVFVTLPVGKFEIAGGCSGLRYLIISMTLTTLYSYLNYTRLASTAILIASGILIALVANWIRVFIIILAGNATNMQHSLVNEHDHFGWLVFAVTLIPLFFLAHKLERNADNQTKENKSAGKQTPNSISRKAAILVIFLAFIAAFGAPGYAAISMANTSNDVEISSLAAPSKLGDWTRSYLKKYLIEPPQFNAPDIAFDGIYSNQAHDIQLSIRSYIQQAPGKELINFNNHLFSSKRYIKLSSGQLRPEGNTYGYIVIKEKTDKRELITYQYNVSYTETSSRLNAKLLEVIRPLVGSPPSTLTYARIKCSTDCADEKRISAQFLNSAKLELNLYVNKNM
ncbi:exosortase A [Alkalimarinus coralli]|uniref:exosortase A n=1 Tax=Alkalimarinus coralli TaxID=2935863 RepID=UPI00202AF5B8|nr:exosortase A [Alkalimarinus coralli]